MGKWFLFFLRSVCLRQGYTSDMEGVTYYSLILSHLVHLYLMYFFMHSWDSPSITFAERFLSLFVRPLYHVSFFFPFWSYCYARDEFHIVFKYLMFTLSFMLIFNLKDLKLRREDHWGFVHLYLSLYHLHMWFLDKKQILFFLQFTSLLNWSKNTTSMQIWCK